MSEHSCHHSLLCTRRATSEQRFPRDLQADLAGFRRSPVLHQYLLDRSRYDTDLILTLNGWLMTAWKKGDCPLMMTLCTLNSLLLQVIVKSLE
jgi:hypothetical protein